MSSDVEKQKELLKEAEQRELFLHQLGWEKRNVGSWVKVLIDDSQGFPQENYECPFCGKVMDYPSIYCPSCGAHLEDAD